MHDSADMVIAEDPRAAAKAAATQFVESVLTALAGRKRAAVALSGGSTPRGMHRMLSQPPFHDAVDWQRIHFFWVDDRLVPHSDAASNFGAALRDLIEPLKLERRQIHPMPVDRPPAAAAADYEQTLRHFFQPTENRLPEFDLVCLGLGADGHTASLFPEDPALLEKRRWIAAVKGGTPCVDRLTLTLPVINSAARVMFLVTGEAKAEIVRQAIERPQMRLPVQHVNPGRGSAVWVLDAPAAKLLSATAGGPRRDFPAG